MYGIHATVNHSTVGRSTYCTQVGQGKRVARQLLGPGPLLGFDMDIGISRSTAGRAGQAIKTPSPGHCVDSSPWPMPFETCFFFCRFCSCACSVGDCETRSNGEHRVEAETRGERASEDGGIDQ